MYKITIFIGAVVIAFLISVVIKNIKRNIYNNKMFSAQFNWYRSYFGDEDAIYLARHLRKTKSPYKTLNDLMKDVNPELFNENLSDI